MQKTRVGLLILFIFLSTTYSTTYAANFSVSDEASLIAAINTANSNGQGDVITLTADITLTTENFFRASMVSAADGGSSLTIEGNGFTLSRSTAPGTPAFRMLVVSQFATVTIRNLTLTNGYLTDAVGGAIGVVINGNLTLENVILTGNEAVNGGAINNAGELTIRDSFITDNIALNSGGAISNFGGTLTISNTDILRNVATGGDGGGIYDTSSLSAITITNGSLIASNSAAGNGGGIFSDSTFTHIDIITTSILDNQAVNGGGIYTLHATIFMQYSGISANLAIGTTTDAAGGGIFARTNLEINDSDISANVVQSATGDAFGGGIALFVEPFGTQSGSLNMVGGTVFNNFVLPSGGQANGGGIYHAGLQVGNWITDSVISDNTADDNGGGLYFICHDCPMWMTNTTISINNSTDGGGIYFDPPGISQLLIIYSTIAENVVSSGNGAGIYSTGGQSIVLENSILANHITGTDYFGSTTIPFLYTEGVNIVEDGSISGVNIINSDPLLGSLADNGGFTETHALLAGSPAIDASIISFSGCPVNDQRGAARDVSCDIGAYEFNGVSPPELTISKSNNASNESIGAVAGASWDWFVTTSNIGAGDAVFGAGDIVFSDQFPTSNISYSSFQVVNIVNISGFGTYTFDPVGGLLTFTVDPASTATVGATTGAITTSVTATTTVAGTYTNPTGGNCRVDPGNVISESDETNNDCTPNSVVVSAPDLEVTKTNGSGGATNLGDANSGAWTWTITLDNTSAGLAEFASGETIFTDNLPDTNISYSAVTVDTAGSTNMTNPGNVSCSIDASFDLICTANGATVGFAGTTGSISLSFTATPTVAATYDNPRSGGSCSIDPSGNVAEDDAGNNTCSDSVIVSASADLSITKDDGVTSVTQGGILIYTIVVSNAGPSDDPNVTVSDIFPASLTATYTSVAGAGATGNTASGSGNISETLNMPSGSSVTYTVVTTVDALATGTISNTATVSGSITDPTPGNNSATDNDTLIVLASGFSKVFSPDTIVLNGTSTLTFTIDNTTNAIVATNLDFTDNLPAGLVIATPSNATTTCTGGTITAVAGTGIVSYTGGTVSAGATCTVTVDVTSAIAATYINTTGDLTSSSGNSGTASDTLIVVPAPLFTKSFSPDPIVLNGTSTLTLTIDNTASILSATNLDFTDNLPGGLVIATPSNASTTCTGGTITAVATTGIINYTGGTVPASASCTVTVDVTSAIASTYTNTSGDLTSSSGNSGTASDTLTVADELAIGKEFTNDPVLTSGGTVILEFTILNPDTTNVASNIAFTDDLTTVFAGLQATTINSNTCGGTVDISTPTLIAFTSGALATNSSCTISLNLLVASGRTPGTYLNTTSSITGIVGIAITGNAASDSLIIQDVPAPPVASISSQSASITVFDPAISKIGFLLPGQVGVTGEELEWIVTVSNTGAIAGNNVIITDTLIDALQIDSVDAPGATVTISGQTVSVTYATLNVGETVQFSIFTTVLDGVEVTNTACVNADNQGAEECANGSFVATLPQTGESPFWRNLLLAIIGLSVSLPILLYNQIKWNDILRNL